MALKIGVLITGRGSNLQSLIDATADPDFPAEIVTVISNRAEAYGLKRAAKAGVHHEVISHRSFETADAFEDAIDETLERAGVELVCLAGFMRILSKAFITKWKNRIVNIHPSLLPSFKGLHVHERVIEAGARISGCSVHFVRAEMDAGPVIIQAAVPVLPEDTPETLAERVLQWEHKIYPQAVRYIAEGRVRIVGEKVRVTGAEAPAPGFMSPEK
jgi:phosphoribosylglycinamide formyltransferase-1